MASFRELPWFYQLGVYFLVAVGVGAAGELVDAPPFLPLVGVKNEEKSRQDELQRLKEQVATLQVYKQDRQRLLTQLEATRAQLQRQMLRVPEKKNTDEFMRLLQREAVNAPIALRRLTAKPVVLRDFYAEMPFEVELDGSYYATLEFFRRLGESTRIVTAEGLKLQGIEAARGQFQYTPGTTVAGVVTVITYYIPKDEGTAAGTGTAPGGPAGQP